MFLFHFGTLHIQRLIKPMIFGFISSYSSSDFLREACVNIAEVLLSGAFYYPPAINHLSMLHALGNNVDNVYQNYSYCQTTSICQSSHKRSEKRPATSYTFSSQNIGATSNDFKATLIKHRTLFPLGVLLIELGLNCSFVKSGASIQIKRRRKHHQSWPMQGQRTQPWAQ